MKVDARFLQLPSFCFRSILSADVLALVILLAAPFAGAQSTGGRIRGTVMDASGGAIASAKVTLINEATHATRDAQTGANGEYIFIEVPVGSYEIDASSQGFKKYVHKGLILNLNEVVTVDLTLQVGGATDVVEVTGAPPVVDTTSTQLGAVVNARAVTELPLNTRNTYQLLSLQPGVQSTVGANLFYGSDQAGVVSVNGGRGRSNDFTVNGGNANDVFVNLPAIQPSPDAIEEFRVITNTFDAEFGRNSGAVVNVVTKSGTNVIHGDVYDFFRNTVLDSRNFFDSTRGNFKQNQFGGTLGGPLKKDSTFLFGSYEGRRTRKGISSGLVALPTTAELGNVSTVAGVQVGDFSGIGAQNNQSEFYGTLADSFFASVLAGRSGGQCNTDVMALQTAAGLPQNGLTGGDPSGNNGASFYSNIFPHERIPTSCFDPTALSLLNYLPAPGVGNVVTNPDSNERDDQFTFRLDRKLTASQQLAVYYYFDDSFRFQPFSFFQAAGANVPGFGDNNKTRFQQWNVSHTWTIGASAVNEARFTYFREGQKTFDHPVNVSSDGTVHTLCPGIAPANCFQGNGFDPSSGITTTLPGHAGLPDISVAGGFTIGNNFEGELPQIGNVFEWSDNYSRIIGKHSLKFGGIVSRDRFDQTLFFETTGLETILSVQDLCHPLNPDSTFCTPSIIGVDDVGFADSYADYLLGYVNTYNQGGNQAENLRNTMLGLFAQDSWKIRPTLTLNYGLRWELNTPYGDLGHRLQTFRPGVADTNFHCLLKPNFPSGLTNPNFTSLSMSLGGTDCSPKGPANAVFPLGLVYPGDGGLPEGVTNTYYKSFAPRVGLAWSPGAREGLLAGLTGGPGKTSIRMGWGIFYNPIEQLVLEQMSAEPPFGGSNTLFGTLLNNPFQFGGGTLAPNPFGSRLSPARGSDVDWSIFRPIVMFGQFQPNQRTQYSEQYNFTIQRQLPGDILFQVGYVGSQGHRLLLSHDLNAGNPQTCLDLIKLLGTFFGCGAFGSDFGYTIPANTTTDAAGNPLPPGFVFHLPYRTGTVGGANVPCPYFNAPPQCLVSFPNNPAIGLVGTRPFSSPFCEPTNVPTGTTTGLGVGCPPDFVPVFTSIFAQDTVGNSDYHSLQVSVEKRFSHGLQFQAGYTFSKSIDDASTFENIVNPFNFRQSRALSLFDARHRFVFSPYWELPIPKHAGFAGKALNGWAVSGIVTFQTGFPIRIKDGNDSELTTSDADFEAVGEPNIVSRVKFLDPHKVSASGLNLFFDPAAFQPSTLGTFGNSPRDICCGPRISQSDISILKKTVLSEKANLEFRAEFYNAFNHTQFLAPDGNFSNTHTFGSVSQARDPRLIQFALKLLF
ncbi:MAG TPA: carboxypeptidase regulatory-like domain-containing protein [Candidatus Acidoferrum sp.]|nr:carboxypeptidase regulatory-like domain-containing protein [Candidatus Acidoferrum sp.]